MPVEPRMNRRGEYGQRGPSARQRVVIGQSYDDIYTKQLTEFRNLRGFDSLAPEPGMHGGIEKIPRTTNADVISLVDYWDKAFYSAIPRVQEMLGHAPEDVDTVNRWKQTRAEVDRHRSPFTLGAIYPKNNSFWREVKRLAIHIAAIKDTPSPWEMAKESVVQSVRALPRNVAEASTVGPAVIREQVTEAAAAAAAPLAKSLLLPLLIGAGVLVGGVVLVKATSKSRD